MKIGVSYSALMPYLRGLDALGVLPQRTIEGFVATVFVACSASAGATYLSPLP
jgi:hypothetical protein